jgi:hypothetical protein
VGEHGESAAGQVGNGDQGERARPSTRGPTGNLANLVMSRAPVCSSNPVALGGHTPRFSLCRVSGRPRHHPHPGVASPACTPDRAGLLKAALATKFSLPPLTASLRRRARRPSAEAGNAPPRQPGFATQQPHRDQRKWSPTRPALTSCAGVIHGHRRHTTGLTATSLTSHRIGGPRRSLTGRL